MMCGQEKERGGGDHAHPFPFFFIRTEPKNPPTQKKNRYVIKQKEKTSKRRD